MPPTPRPAGAAVPAAPPGIRRGRRSAAGRGRLISSCRPVAAERRAGAAGPPAGEPAAPAGGGPARVGGRGVRRRRTGRLVGHPGAGAARLPHDGAASGRLVRGRLGAGPAQPRRRPAGRAPAVPQAVRGDTGPATAGYPGVHPTGAGRSVPARGRSAGAGGPQFGACGSGRGGSRAGAGPLTGTAAGAAAGAGRGDRRVSGPVLGNDPARRGRACGPRSRRCGPERPCRGRARWPAAPAPTAGARDAAVRTGGVPGGGRPVRMPGRAHPFRADRRLGRWRPRRPPAARDRTAPAGPRVHRAGRRRTRTGVRPRGAVRSGSLGDPTPGSGAGRGGRGSGRVHGDPAGRRGGRPAGPIAAGASGRRTGSGRSVVQLAPGPIGPAAAHPALVVRQPGPDRRGVPRRSRPVRPEAIPPGSSCAPGVRRGRSVPGTTSITGASRRASTAARQPSSAAVAKSSATDRAGRAGGQDGVTGAGAAPPDRRTRRRRPPGPAAMADGRTGWLRSMSSGTTPSRSGCQLIGTCR